MKTIQKTKFTDEEFLSSKEKEQIYKAWKRFIDSKFTRKSFTEAIYQHLILHCSFIAHYDINGFYGEYFQNPQMTIKFLSQFDKVHDYKSVEYGWINWWRSEMYQDINKALIDYIRPKIPDLYRMLFLKLKYKRELELELARRELSEIDELIKSDKSNITSFH